MKNSGPGCSSVPGNSAHTVALDFDLNETPLGGEAASGNGDGSAADHRCGSYGEVEGKVVVCCDCAKHFHVVWFGSVEGKEWRCSECSMECRRGKRLQRTVSTGSGSDLGLLDMNASPAREIEGDDAGFWVNSELALTNSALKMQDTYRDPFLGFASTSSNTRTNMRYIPNGFPSTTTSYSTTNLDIARTNLDIATQNANLVYLQALNDYISEQRGDLGDGWCVKFEYSETTCKTSPIYCAPDGSRYDSMPEVAHYLGLLSSCNSFQRNDSGSLLQNGSHATKIVEAASRSMRAREHKHVVSNGGNGIEVDPMENGNHGSESFLDGFPVQFEDFFVMSIGKIDPQRPFHNPRQIWPIGYKSIWHDKLTGSIFICNILDGDNYGPIFRVNRHPCSKQSLPNPSTIIHKPKSDEIATSLTTESTLPSENLINADVIGEYSIEGRTPSSAWQMALETLICACRQAFQDLSVVTFGCNHSVDGKGQYGHDSLDKFGSLSGLVDSIPNLILTSEQLEVASMVLRRWLKPDRFGLDAEFVQELIEQLPGVANCSEYKSLDARCQDSIGLTVRSGFFTVSHKYRDARLTPPGHTIASNLPPCLIGDVLQAYEFYLRFHKLLGRESQDAPFSRQNIENELLDSCESYKIAPGTILSNFHVAMLKVLVEDTLAKVVICDPFMEIKSRKGRKKNTEFNFLNKKTEPGLFPINEITWPEVARRYILVLLSMDDNYESPDMTTREFDQVFRCLNGDGGPLCGSLTGMAAIEADVKILAEASKKMFSLNKNGDLMIQIDKDLDSVTKKRPDNKCPEWIKVLEPVRSQPTNVGARIRNRVFKSLEKEPPEWATEMLLRSISKDVYKGNAAGPTKKIVVSVLDKVRDENPLTKKKAKESRGVKTISDVIIKRCRMVLRCVAAEDENKAFFGFLKPNESDDVAFSRQLDFRIIDLRLDAGFYDDSLESFIEDVHEVWQNLRVTYRKKPKYIDLIDQISTKLEELYKQEVLTLVSKTVDYYHNSSEETKKELNTMVMDTITTTLFIAPWEDGICKVCGIDENDHILLLCDRCDAEYHTYCLDPPLQRVPKASWYCPNCISFITTQAMSRGEDWGPAISKKKNEREFNRNGLEELADLADVMELKEYWELGVKERVFLLNFLCDESLSSALIQTHMSEDGYNFQTNFLGRDSDERLYWVLGYPERVFSSFTHGVGVPSESSWICYESDDEIEGLIGWLRSDDAREKELEQNIKHWLRNKSNDQIGQPEVIVDRFKSTVLRTNARAELEKKFGLLLEGEIYRCDCLELVGPTWNHHCFSCHSTFFNNEVHRCLEPEGINGKNVKNQLSLTPVVGKGCEMLPCLKTVLLDIEAALPVEAFRPSRRNSDRVRGWRAFLKSARSIYEMVEASIVLEDMIKTEYLRKEWRYWSSPSSAAKISTVSALGLQIYALDAAVFYEPPPPADLMEVIVAGDSESKEETPRKSNLKNYRKMIAMLNDSETKKKKLEDWSD